MSTPAEKLVDVQVCTDLCVLYQQHLLSLFPITSTSSGSLSLPLLPPPQPPFSVYNLRGCNKSFFCFSSSSPFSSFSSFPSFCRFFFFFFSFFFWFFSYASSHRPHFQSQFRRRFRRRFRRLQTLPLTSLNGHSGGNTYRPAFISSPLFSAPLNKNPFPPKKLPKS